MEFKVQVVNTPEELKGIEAAIRTAVGEQLERHAHIEMEVLSQVPEMQSHEDYVSRLKIRRILEIKVEVDITDVPLTVKPGK